MNKKSIKDYIRKQIDKELNKRLEIPVKNFTFTIDNHLDNYGVPIMPQTRELRFTLNYQAIDPELLKISMKDLEPKDDTITFMLAKKGDDDTPKYMTFRGTKFTSYNRAHVLDPMHGEPEYVMTSVAVDPEVMGWKKKKKKTKPRFTPAQRKSMR